MPTVGPTPTKRPTSLGGSMPRGANRFPHTSLKPGTSAHRQKLNVHHAGHVHFMKNLALAGGPSWPSYCSLASDATLA
jgi:hypothetical protein